MSTLLTPEQLIKFLKKDLESLELSDKVNLFLHLNVVQGWHGMRKSHYHFPIKGRVEDITEIIKSLMLDSSSILVTESKKVDNNPGSFLRERYGQYCRFFWVDSDSPLYFKLMGTISSSVNKSDEETDVDLEMIAAMKEIKELGKKKSISNLKTSLKQ